MTEDDSDQAGDVGDVELDYNDPIILRLFRVSIKKSYSSIEMPCCCISFLLKGIRKIQDFKKDSLNCPCEVSKFLQ